MRHISAVDPTPFFAKYGENVWAGLKGYLDKIARTAAAHSQLGGDRQQRPASGLHVQTVRHANDLVRWNDKALAMSDIRGDAIANPDALDGGAEAHNACHHAVAWIEWIVYPIRPVSSDIKDTTKAISFGTSANQ